MSCSWLMMIFWLFWADSDSLPVLDLHFKSNCWWTETINLWTPICHYATSKPSEMYPAKPNTFRSSSSVSWFGDIGSCQRPAFCNHFIETKLSKSQWKGQQDLLTKPGNMTVSGKAHYIFNEVASCLDQPWAMVLKDLHHGCSSVQSSSHIHPSNAFDPESLARWHGDMVHERTSFSSTTTLLQLPNLPKKKNARLASDHNKALEYILVDSNSPVCQEHPRKSPGLYTLDLGCVNMALWNKIIVKL